jgi:hypothetical protein
VYGNGLYILNSSEPYGYTAVPIFHGPNQASWGGGFQNTDQFYGAPGNLLNLYTYATPFPEYMGPWISLKMPVSIYLLYIQIWGSDATYGAYPYAYRLYGKNDTCESWMLLMEETGTEYVTSRASAQIVHRPTAFQFSVQ